MSVMHSNEYISLLWNIQNDNIRSSENPWLIPAGKEIYQIDLNQRTIYGPKTISVQHDHQAETVFFELDRYFDRMDLSTTVGIIQYRTPGGKNYVYVIPYFDTATKGDKKIVFPWEIDYAVTEYSGAIRYAIKFYKINALGELVYELNTKPASSIVEAGWSAAAKDIVQSKGITISNDYLKLFQNIQEIINSNQLFVNWVDISQLQPETPPEREEEEENVLVFQHVMNRDEPVENSDAYITVTDVIVEEK